MRSVEKPSKWHEDKKLFSGERESGDVSTFHAPLFLA